MTTTYCVTYRLHDMRVNDRAIVTHRFQSRLLRTLDIIGLNGFATVVDEYEEEDHAKAEVVDTEAVALRAV